jgi:hypothetical protein
VKNPLLELERTLVGSGVRAPRLTPVARSRSASAPPHGGRRPFGMAFDAAAAIDYSVPGTVTPLRRTTATSSWAVIGGMLVAWRDRAPRTFDEIIAAIDPSYAERIRMGSALTPAELTGFLARVGLVSEPAEEMTSARWESLLRAYGPICVATDEELGGGRGAAPRLVTGIHGDGSAGGTRLDVVDPATGTAYSETVEEFAGRGARDGGATRGDLRVVHWPRDVQFAVARTLRYQQALAEQADRNLLTDDELADAEPSVPELAPRDFKPSHAAELSVAAAAPAKMTASDARWADDKVSPDFRHLPAVNTSQQTQLTGALLRHLCQLNSFVFPADAKRVVIGLRGCQVIAPSSAFAKSVAIAEDTPNHIDNRCAMGVWNRDDDTIVLFGASTVPNWRLMENYRQGGDGSNMLPTGLFKFKVGTHRPTRKVKQKNQPTRIEQNPNRVQGALLQAEYRVELRTKDDLTYTVYDIWDGGWVGDNIHPGLKPVNPSPSTEPDFSSAGCNTIPGFSKNDKPSGAWEDFRAALGFDNKNPTADDGKTVWYALFTGRDARLAADRPDDTSLTRLRFGSSGTNVTALQLELRRMKGNDRLKAGGKLDEPTALAYIKWQQSTDAGAADCIVTPVAASTLGFDMVKGQSIPATAASRTASPFGGYARPRVRQQSGSGSSTKKKSYIPATIPLDPASGGQSIGVDALQVGDIILSTTPEFISSAIRRATKSDVSHAILYIGDGEVVEAVASGVVRRPLADAISASYAAVALRDPKLTSGQAAAIRKSALGWVGKKYDTFALVDQGIRKVSGKDPEWRDPEAFFCSELVLQAYADAGEPLTTVAPDQSAPQDVVTVYLSKKLEYVGHLKTQL